MKAESQKFVFKYGESPAVLVPLNEKIKYKINYNDDIKIFEPYKMIS